MSTKDDVYEGYFIPKGSLVLTNSWFVPKYTPALVRLMVEDRAILHDPTAYPDPGTFDPGRFLRPRDGAKDEFDVELNPDILDPAVAAFGFGRRICPGRHMAYESLWISIASIVAAFDITKAVDEHGKAIELSGEYIGDFVS